MPALLLIVVLALGGCSKEAPPPPPPTHQVVTALSSELVFELPLHWKESPAQSARVFAGPPGAPDQSATITLQTLSNRWSKAPDLALQAALEAHPDLSAVLLHQTPVVLTTPSTPQPALLYSMAFAHHREPFRRVGLLLPHGEKLLDLHYTAQTPLFAPSLPVFEHLLESLSTTP